VLILILNLSSLAVARYTKRGPWLLQLIVVVGLLLLFVLPRY